MDVELILRILMGTALGAIIGYERDIHGRPAGLRTHAVVALASATFMVISTHLAYYQHYGTGDFTNIDGSRIAASVVSGIGFLAGGAILRTGLNVQGLTTAAGLWMVAAIGLAAGGGLYYESIAATVVGVLVLTYLRRFEDKDDRVRRRLTVTLTDAAVSMEALVARLVAADLLTTIEGWNREHEIAARSRSRCGCRAPTARIASSSCSRRSPACSACGSIRRRDHAGTGAPRVVTSGMMPAKYGSAASAPSSATGGPVRIFAAASAIGNAITRVACSSVSSGGRHASARPATILSSSAASTRRFSVASSTARPRPNITTER